MQHDEVRLQHMLDAAKEAVEFAAGKLRKDLDSDRMLTLAITKSIEIIGEAASRVTEECKTENDNIPWNDISGMRNRLIHGYFDINLDIVWETVKEDLPALLIELEKIVPQEKNP